MFLLLSGAKDRTYHDDALIPESCQRIHHEIQTLLWGMDTGEGLQRVRLVMAHLRGHCLKAATLASAGGLPAKMQQLTQSNNCQRQTHLSGWGGHPIPQAEPLQVHKRYISSSHSLESKAFEYTSLIHLY